MQREVIKRVRSEMPFYRWARAGQEIVEKAMADADADADVNADADDGCLEYSLDAAPLSRIWSELVRDGQIMARTDDGVVYGVSERSDGSGGFTAFIDGPTGIIHTLPPPLSAQPTTTQHLLSKSEAADAEPQPRCRRYGGDGWPIHRDAAAGTNAAPPTNSRAFGEAGIRPVQGQFLLLL